MDNNQQKIPNCRHIYASLGMEKVSTSETYVEVLTAIFCTQCGYIKSKMLYFDRQRKVKNGKLGI